MSEKQEKYFTAISIAAKDTAIKINGKMPNNKINSYKQKLISAISLKDYDRVQVILIQLSAFANVKMDFLVELFNDFEENKNLAYTFINTLGNYEEKNNQNKGENK